MNNEPVGKRDVANVLSKYLKSVLNANIFCATAKQLNTQRGDFIVDMIYKIYREVRNEMNSSHVFHVWRVPKHHHISLVCFPVIDALPVWWHSFVCLC